MVICTTSHYWITSLGFGVARVSMFCTLGLIIWLMHHLLHLLKLLHLLVLVLHAIEWLRLIDPAVLAWTTCCIIPTTISAYKVHVNICICRTYILGRLWMLLYITWLILANSTSCKLPSRISSSSRMWCVSSLLLISNRSLFEIGYVALQVIRISWVLVTTLMTPSLTTYIVGLGGQL